MENFSDRRYETVENGDISSANNFVFEKIESRSVKNCHFKIKYFKTCNKYSEKKKYHENFPMSSLVKIICCFFS